MRLVQLLKLNIFHFDFSGNTELRRVVLSMTGATYHTIHPGKTGSVQSRVSPACCSPQLIGSVPGSGSRDSVISGLLGQVQRRDWGPTSGSSLYHCYLATCSHSGLVLRTPCRCSTVQNITEHCKRRRWRVYFAD